MSTESPAGSPISHPKGERLHCETCGSEIEIVNPSTVDPPEYVFRCCGADMTPILGRDINLGVE